MKEMVGMTNRTLLSSSTKLHVHVFVCLTLLASFFLPSHLSFKNVYNVYVCILHSPSLMAVKGVPSSVLSLISFRATSWPVMLLIPCRGGQQSGTLWTTCTARVPLNPSSHIHIHVHVWEFRAGQQSGMLWTTA